MKINFIVIFFSLFVFSFCLKAQTTTTSDSTKSDTTYKMVDVMPQFPGGDQALFEFLMKNLQYPSIAREKGTMGTVIVNFTVTTTGEIDAIKIIKSVGDGCDEEALRVVKLLPNFIPGTQNGKPVSVYFNLPINFKLNSSSKTKKSKN